MMRGPAQVWSFWVGRKPAWIELCLETLRRHNPGIQILDDSAWDTLYDGPIPLETIRLQAPNVQSDFLRAWLLVHHGGIWVDADCICFRSLAGVEDVLGEADFLAYKKGRVMSALLACRPGSRIAAEYLSEMVRRLKPGKRLGTLALGPVVLRRAISETRAPLALIPTELIHPAQTRRFGVDLRLQAVGGLTVRPDAWTCMLTHRALGQLGRLDRAALLNHPSITGEFFRRALGISQPFALGEQKAQTPDNARVLIGALSGDQHADRRKRCLRSWIPALEAHGIGTVFLRGRQSVANDWDDNWDDYNLTLPVDDDRICLLRKTQEFCRWALQRSDWDYLFKCDDDTFIHPNRFVGFLEELSAKPVDYLGGRWKPNSPYASGGAGYFLSRRAAEIVARGELPLMYEEDLRVGALLVGSGIEFTADQRFNSSCKKRSMRDDPSMITTHGVRTAKQWNALAAFSVGS